MIIEIDALFPSVTIDGKYIEFSKREYDLFLFLWQNRGKICTRNIIQSSIWRGNYYHDEQLVDKVITRIRKKIGKTGILVKTVKGFGYRI